MSNCAPYIRKRSPATTQEGDNAYMVGHIPDADQQMKKSPTILMSDNFPPQIHN